MTQRMKILIGYDGSSCSNAALDDLKRAGLPQHATAEVLTAADVFLPRGKAVPVPAAIKGSIHKAHQAARKKVKEADALAKKAAKKIRALFPRWKVIPRACADSAAWAIVKEADKWKADLIVMGAHGHSKLGRLIGSVSQNALVNASQPVRIARFSPDMDPEKIRVVIGVDGSEGAKAAIAAVSKRTWTSPVEILLISVVEPKMSALIRHITPPEIRWILEQADDSRRSLGQILEFYAKPLREKGALVTCLVVSGDPKRVLVDQADTWKADCIFVGARGLSNLKRLLMGGVSTAVSARAPCSVEVIR